MRKYFQGILVRTVFLRRYPCPREVLRVIVVVNLFEEPLKLPSLTEGYANRCEWEEGVLNSAFFLIQTNSTKCIRWVPIMCVTLPDIGQVSFFV